MFAKNAFLLLIIFISFGLLAKQVTLIRTVRFASECLDPNELHAVQSRSARNWTEEEISKFVGEAFTCIRAKQSKLEHLIVDATGYFWIN